MARAAVREPRFVAPEPAADRSGAKLGVSLLLLVSLVGLFSSLTLYQLTAEGVAKRTLSRSVAALTEIDPLLDRNYDDLQQRAGAAAPADTLQVRDFPIAVPLTPAQAKTISRQDLRALLLERSADALYADGTSALRAPAAHAGSVGVFSVAGISDRGLGFLTTRNHDILRVLTFALAAVSLALAAALGMLCRGFGRLAAVGGVTLAAAVPWTLGGFGVWLYLRAVDGAGTEYTKAQFAQIGRELAWIPIRDGAALGLLGALMLILGIALARWSDGRLRARYDAVRPIRSLRSWHRSDRG